MTKLANLLSYNLNPQEKKIVYLAALGGMLEFYDFIIYGIFSVYFAHQFFPNNNNLMTIIESYVVFVLGYIARPLGGIIFSHIGDEYGRKKVLIITIILMGVSSLGIGMLPTYNQIGITSPIMLLVLRLIQGLALGGELPSTYVYISESMPLKRGSGFGGVMTGVNGGLLLGMLVNQLLSLIFSQNQITAFAWRIPFVIGGMLCLISYKIRQTLQETKEFTQINNHIKFPLIVLLKNHLPQVLSGILLTATMAATVVTTIIFMPTYLGSIIRLDKGTFSYLMTILMLANVATIFITGRLANAFNPAQLFKYILIISIPLIICSYLLIATRSFLPVALVILGIIEGTAAMLVPLLISLLFPPQVRLTGVAFCYNISFTLFGGLAPVLITSLINLGYNSYIVPSTYLIIVLCFSLVGIAHTKLNSRFNNRE